MALIAIRQPNNLLMLFSTVSCSPIKINLNRDEFIKEYINCYNGCFHMTSEQIIDDAIDTVNNHVNPLDRFYESYIPCYARSEEEIEDAIAEIENKCSVIV